MKPRIRLASGLCLATLCSAFAFTAYSGETTLEYLPWGSCEKINTPQGQKDIKDCRDFELLLNESINHNRAIEGYGTKKMSRLLTDDEIQSKASYCEDVIKTVMHCVGIPTTPVSPIKDEASKKLIVDKVPSFVPTFPNLEETKKTDLPKQ